MTATANLEDFDIEVLPNPHVRELTRAEIQAEADRCLASGASPDFYIGVLERMDAFEQSLAPKPDAPAPAPQAPIPRPDFNG